MLLLFGENEFTNEDFLWQQIEPFLDLRVTHLLTYLHYSFYTLDNNYIVWGQISYNYYYNKFLWKESSVSYPTNMHEHHPHKLINAMMFHV